jgi:diguanylate cyclase (GGDEF)-like protein
VPVTGWSVNAQTLTIVAVVAGLLAGAGVWLSQMRLDEAERQAVADATFQARLGAAATSDALVQAESSALGLAAGIRVADVVAAASDCTLDFSGLGVFTMGHIDIVLPDGVVPCSSVSEMGAPPGATHSGAEWLSDASAATESGVTAPFTDRLTGQPAVAVTAPVTEAGGQPTGFVAVVLPLAGLPVGLAQVYGGPEALTFTVHDASGRSLGTDPDLTSDPGAAADQIVGHDTVADLGWVVSAGQSRAEALATVRAAQLRRLAVEGAAIVLLLGLLGWVNRRIARPLRRLTTAAKEAARQLAPAPVAERGPAEVRHLAREFNTMITARTEYERQLTHHTLHDPLTGLPNRALLLDRVEQALHAASESPQVVSVLSIDLDRFKLVNATVGYRQGDDVLTAVATRLKFTLGASDTLARAGGDGFMICRHQTGDQVAQRLAERVMARLAEPFTVGQTSVTLTASVGVAIGRRGVSAEELVRDSDTAMYAAKDAGGGRYQLIDDELRTRSSERMTLEADLRHALVGGQLHVAYQPVVNLLTGRITGAEALVRWSHPTRGPVSPLTFIPVAEAAGLIGPIGQFVLDEACKQARTWAVQGHPVRIAVNVSGLQLRDPDFVRHVADALHTHRLEPSQLCLELTESILMQDTVRASDVLRELKEIGVDLSVDDFGTGYSSLAYLRRFPVDELKIDGSFMQNLNSAEADQTLVAAMVAMGHALGLQVVAEGVETHAQRATLLTLGCRTAQGFLFCRPQPADQITEVLRTGLPAEFQRPVTADQHPG